MNSGVCEYDHVNGTKLGDGFLKAKEEDGWTLLSHTVQRGSIGVIHSYVFKRMREEASVSK
jgi:hypothetical protein